MSDQSLTAASPVAEVLYGRLPQRINALVVDGAILACLLVLGPLLGEVLTDSAARILNRAVLVCILLYEPVLVSLRGGTVGHDLLNLEVVSSTTGGRLSFLRAVVRFVAKAGLGLFSFFTVALTARHQAVHDIFGGAVVQARDPSRASPAHFARERVPGRAPAAGVSRLRRVSVVAGYLAATLLLAALAAGWVVSRACVDTGLCSTAEDDRLAGLFLLWLGAGGVIAVLGWRGRLPGARRRDPAELQPEGAGRSHESGFEP